MKPESASWPGYVLAARLGRIAAAAVGLVLLSLCQAQPGTVWGWGDNQYSQLGIGIDSVREVPVQVVGLTNVSAIAAGGDHCLALRNNGTVWAWGRNGSGQLGDGTATHRSLPVPTQGLTSMIAVATGGHHSLAIRSDGTVWAWGRNESGQLGDGTSTERWSPVQTQGLTNVIAISAGYSHSLALGATARCGPGVRTGADNSGTVRKQTVGPQFKRRARRT